MKDEQQKAARHPQTSNWSGSDRYVNHNFDMTERDDQTLAQEAEELLAQIDLSNVSVSASAGEVTLEGYAARLSDKIYAEEVVIDLDGVKAVQNNLRIAPERH